MKPDKWQDVPDTLLESILRDINLDYDSYEGSMDETVARILNGNVSCTNEKIIGAYWKALSEDDFQLRCGCMISYLQDQIRQLTNL